MHTNFDLECRKINWTRIHLRYVFRLCTYNYNTHFSRLGQTSSLTCWGRIETTIFTIIITTIKVHEGNWGLGNWEVTAHFNDVNDVNQIKSWLIGLVTIDSLIVLRSHILDFVDLLSLESSVFSASERFATVRKPDTAVHFGQWLWQYQIN